MISPSFEPQLLCAVSLFCVSYSVAIIPTPTNTAEMEHDGDEDRPDGVNKKRSAEDLPEGGGNNARKKNKNKKGAFIAGAGSHHPVSRRPYCNFLTPADDPFIYCPTTPTVRYIYDNFLYVRSDTAVKLLHFHLLPPNAPGQDEKKETGAAGGDGQATGNADRKWTGFNKKELSKVNTTAYVNNEVISKWKYVRPPTLKPACWFAPKVSSDQKTLTARSGKECKAYLKEAEPKETWLNFSDEDKLATHITTEMPYKELYKKYCIELRG